MNDWRLGGQERFLLKAKLAKRRYSPPNEKWDHDHCAFCWAKFPDAPQDLHEGYVTVDDYHWICPQCYEDFKQRFLWYLVEK